MTIDLLLSGLSPVIAVPLYFSPTIVGWWRRRASADQESRLALLHILALNTLLGWLIPVWVGVWLMALSSRFDGVVMRAIMRSRGHSPPPGASGPSGAQPEPGQPQACSRCGGQGTESCSMCGGRGSWYEQAQTATDIARLQTCNYCTSSGRVRCSSCNGSGRAAF
jgi:hypothetical protein